MSRVFLVALFVASTGCAPNRWSKADGARIRDTTLSRRDTMIPNDTLARMRDRGADSTR